MLEALKLDDTLAEGHSILGVLLGMGNFDWIGAEREWRRALDTYSINPEPNEFSKITFEPQNVE